MTFYKIEENYDKIDFGHMLAGDTFVTDSGEIFVKIQEVNLNCSDHTLKNAVRLSDGALVYFLAGVKAATVNDVIVRRKVKS